MVMHLLDAGDIFSSDDRSLPGLVGRNHAVQMDDTITDSHLETDWTPVGCVDYAANTITNVIVIRGRIRDFVRHASDGLEQVRPGNDSGQRVAAHHGQPLDTFLLH